MLEQIQALLSKGRTPKELIQEGFPRSSVYRARKLLARKDDPIKRLLEEARMWGEYKAGLCSFAQGKECEKFTLPLDPLMCALCPEYSP